MLGCEHGGAGVGGPKEGGVGVVKQAQRLNIRGASFDPSNTVHLPSHAYSSVHISFSSQQPVSPPGLTSSHAGKTQESGKQKPTAPCIYPTAGPTNLQFKPSSPVFFELSIEPCKHH